MRRLDLVALLLGLAVICVGASMAIRHWLQSAEPETQRVSSVVQWASVAECSAGADYVSNGHTLYPTATWTGQATSAGPSLIYEFPGPKSTPIENSSGFYYNYTPGTDVEGPKEGECLRLMNKRLVRWPCGPAEVSR